MKEVKNGNKAIRIISNMMFYGQYYKDEFQVLDSAEFSKRKYNNWVKNYGFWNIKRLPWKMWSV